MYPLKVQVGGVQTLLVKVGHLRVDGPLSGIWDVLLIETVAPRGLKKDRSDACLGELGTKKLKQLSLSQQLDQTGKSVQLFLETVVIWRRQNKDILRWLNKPDRRNVIIVLVSSSGRIGRAYTRLLFYTILLFLLCYCNISEVGGVLL